MQASLPPSLFATGRTIHHLRSEIEGATGCALAYPRRSDAAGVVWGREGVAARALERIGRPPVVVEAGPILSPYDTPATGMSSLRLRYRGTPVETPAPPTDILGALRERRLYGRNRFALEGSAALEAHFSGAPARSLILVDEALAAAPRRLRAFVERVLADRPDENFLAAGPDGCRGLAGGLSARLAVLDEPANPWLLFERATRIHVASWESGAAARLSGYETHCVDPAASGAPPSDAALTRLFEAGIHTFDPWTREPIAAGDGIERVAWLRDRFAANDRRVVYVGISGWKRPALDVFADGPHGSPVHTMTAEDAVGAGMLHQARVLAWATREPEQLEARCAEVGLPLARIEDGFLRSVGLGASLQPGASIVVDDQGIYYDPRKESRLSLILAHAAFPPALVARAGALREAIVARRLSKYNVGVADADGDWPSGRRVVLVPGQVEDDASVLHGSPHVRSNRDLLRAARARNPEAYLLFKPHPDVEAGFRPGAIPEAEALTLADRIVGGISIVDLLDRVQHVETMTSLAGFEALIRGLTVAVHGRPFYSGWGLTEDLAPNAARGRTLVLDELVAGALILYPRYLDPVAMKPCSPEQLLDRLSAARDAAPRTPLSLSRTAQVMMRARYALLNPIMRYLRNRRGVSRGSGGKPR
ncbi:capsular polysaccharide export protein, LipB/KpsS family [Methylobacterium planeticum]|uniref:Capsular biosynthesis protein n=1 Tax=Methylobacterium planeticum TaxID=2615211 RepID=A0A6N6MES4_9HYPH|nr:capsular biosynthesis protein [Methylobacterium planeticum]KAB1068260.1 capsular biosynthesis protein [Methylobacterium planeticum]